MKKCLIPSLNYALVASCFLLTALSASAAIPARAPKASMETLLRSDLASFRREKQTDFQGLIERWERVYGESSAPSLLKIGQDKSAQDSERYVALLAHTKIRGVKNAEALLTLLDDRSWMVRSAALKSIEILGYQPAAKKVLEHLASDPALVIRMQSIETLVKLRPDGLANALVNAAMDSHNYRPGNFRTGRADWVPQKAMEALREIGAKEVTVKLLPLMNESKDGRIRAHALHTIEVLENRSLKKGRPFSERALAWNQALR
ncbi:MAG: HEAT repeat domain-containing protein [Cryobacterium sp.]|nr:HEAT repeat domain-containing protein [Oligoflexia bacterium]